MMNTEMYENWITASWNRYLQRKCNNTQGENPAEVAGILAQLEKAIVVSCDDIIPGRVQFGSCVTVYGIEEQEEISFQISCDDQAKEFKTCVGISSPLAQALLGTQEGDVVEVHLTDSAKVTYEVTHIKMPSI